ncbi:Eco29kI family restriction endonuclease [Sulfitobacter sabulilitoris]|uniref:Eco29kI family restriction endonuclease n=1 Tax=Sulfitobacter sabulilitoris TaxID=2562655 RepID=A0A5S3PL49_9RHOB|nr:Eco29kI family restriction endonuclease [Sulfitobacter sabulilitoris]TMM55129.1 Eco29kI family restriction endonuclease [Sulfitobacter sabulilitoris]
MTGPSRKGVLNAIAGMKERLEQLEQDVDPVRLPDAFFDPAEPRLIGHFVALALISQDRVRLDAIQPFYGAGVYAIYYTGPENIYGPISGTETPIYVGKADPPVGATSVVQQETKLYVRLNEHRRNIDKVAGIDLADFECRALAVQSGYQAAAESHLINLFWPIWNNETKILFGLGKHGDSAKTRSNNKSPWDTIHPGRTWAEGNPEAKSAEDILADVARHFGRTRIFGTNEDVFAAFAEGIRRADRIDASDEDEPDAEPPEVE